MATGTAHYERRTQYVDKPHPGGLFCSLTDEHTADQVACRELEVITAIRVAELATAP